MSQGSRFRPAAELLKELGITEPVDIDIEAIAEFCGATVLERHLEGCEARIAGFGDRAIITVNADAPIGRRRFSAAHELGHWLRDAGEVALRCNPESAFENAAERETRANSYATDILMPRRMFEPRTVGRAMTLETAAELAEVFQTSLTATAIRLVVLGPLPAMVVCTDKNRVRWSWKGPEVPRLPPEGPGRRSIAYSVHQGGPGAAGDVPSGEWFSRGSGYYLHEEARRITGELVLSMLWWTDEGPLIELQEEDERRAYRRSDWREDD